MLRMWHWSCRNDSESIIVSAISKSAQDNDFAEWSRKQIVFIAQFIQPQQT
jgi:hypothetical protein